MKRWRRWFLSTAAQGALIVQISCSAGIGTWLHVCYAACCACCGCPIRSSDRPNPYAPSAGANLRTMSEAWEIVRRAAQQRGLANLPSEADGPASGMLKWKYQHATIALAFETFGFQLLETPETYAHKMATYMASGIPGKNVRRDRLKLDCRFLRDGQPHGETLCASIQTVMIGTTRLLYLK